MIQLIVTPHILEKVQGQIKEVCRLIEPCLLIGTREYMMGHPVDGDHWEVTFWGAPGFIMVMDIFVSAIKNLEAIQF